MQIIDRKVLPVISLLAMFGLASANIFNCLPEALAEHPTAIAASPGGAAGNNAPIKIGFITSLSGVAAEPSQDMVNGIKLYLDQVHYKMAGHPVELIVENDESNPATAIAKVRKLVQQDKVQVIAGFLLSNVGYAASKFAEREGYQVPLVYVVSSGDDLTQRKRSGWVIRASRSSSQVTQPLGEWVHNTLGYKKIITLSVDDPYGYESVGGFQKAFEQAGGQVVQKVWVPLGFRDFATQIKSLQHNADAVFLSTTAVSATIIPKQYKDLGPKLPVTAVGTSFDESVLRHLGDEALGAISSLNYSAALDTPSNKRFVREYRAKFHGDDPDSYADNGYTAALIINKAVEMLKGDLSDANKFLAALKKVELTDAPRGPFKLDDYGNPIQNVYVRKVEKVNGKLQNTVIATFPNVSQFWKSTPAEFLKQPVYSRDYPPCTHCQPQK